jgi:hypothetical protein
MHAYGEPYTLRPDGFPITKQIIVLVIDKRDSLPVLNGALGGNLLGGLWDRIGGETEAQLECAAAIDRLRARHSQLPIHLVDKGFGRSIVEWARAFLAEFTAPYAAERRMVIGCAIWMHDRLYMSNNFLQHLHLCEPILPFATAELVQQKLAVRDGTMSFEGFRAALGRHFPEIGDIPHTHDIERPAPCFRLSSRSKREWALQCLVALRRRDALGAFSHEVLAPRLALAAVDGRFEYVAQTAMRFLLLEALLNRLGLNVDWKG